MDGEIRLKQAVLVVSRYCHSSEEANTPEKSRRRSGLTGWQVKRVTDYVDARLEGPVRVDDLAAAARLSPGHFRRAFSISFGMSPYAFVMQQRIERARALLLASEHVARSPGGVTIALDRPSAAAADEWAGTTARDRRLRGVTIRPRLISAR